MFTSNTKFLKPWQRGIAERYAATGRTVIVRRRFVRTGGKAHLSISLNGGADMSVSDAIDRMAKTLGNIVREAR